MIPYKEIIGNISEIEPFARDTSIDDLDRLRKLYGRGRWRKLKGRATVRLMDDSIRTAEIHWYEADGIGKRDIKIRRLLK